MVNVVLHAFENLAKRSKYSGCVICRVFASFTEEVAPFSIFSRIDAIQGHPYYGTFATEPVFFKLTEQYYNIPVACKGLVWEMF